MLRESVRRLAFMSPGDLYALTQRSSFSSYTQYSDASALTRSYQRCSAIEKLRCEERSEAINDEIERAYNTDAQLQMQDNIDLPSDVGSAAAQKE
ncbi:unspecified product [Leishmania tarentolae]|uniref:Unspecified product n=1 Tax=Leishmania tarentolae TaxID=5689 RepID=A0A640KD63_LEITA|nr:unspecified product [Leishmania tarentolae]